MGLNSCLYECRVMHHRFSPKEHRFAYRIFMFYLDLDELEELDARLRFFSYQKSNVYAFREEDHLLFGARNVKEGIGTYLKENGLERPTGKIQLLTLPRVFGYTFNPVSFYFCQDATNREICAVAEVGNTFAEKKPFLLTQRKEGFPRVWHERRTKHFYVSPFLEHDLEFDFQLRQPGEKLALEIDDYKSQERVLHTTLTGERRELTDRRLLSLTARYPLVTLKVIAGIHWEAWRLWLKGLPYCGKTEHPELQRDVHSLRHSVQPNAKAERILPEKSYVRGV